MITELYCEVDDFYKLFSEKFQKSLLGLKTQTGPKPEMSIPEMMTIVIMFHVSNFRTFKTFYLHIQHFYKMEFPNIISYSRFVYLKKNLLIFLFSYLFSKQGKVTGISFIDATSIKVCHNKRIRRNKVFKKMAKRGKTTTGWFYGFKLFLVVNELGEILSFYLAPGNISDTKPVEGMTKNIIGKLFGDKGFISNKLFEKLYRRNLELITSIRANMKNKFINLRDKILLRKRSIIETINDQLKNISQIEHTRHRSPANFFVNLLSGLIAYSHQSKKPSINFSENDLKCLPSLI